MRKATQYRGLTDLMTLAKDLLLSGQISWPKNISELITYNSISNQFRGYHSWGTIEVIQRIHSSHHIKASMAEYSCFRPKSISSIFLQLYHQRANDTTKSAPTQLAHTNAVPSRSCTAALAVPPAPCVPCCIGAGLSMLHVCPAALLVLLMINGSLKTKVPPEMLVLL